MNNIRARTKINERELALLGRADSATAPHASWHDDFAGAPWIYVGGLVAKLTEGDVRCVFSQWGEIEDVYMPRGEPTSKDGAASSASGRPTAPGTGSNAVAVGKVAPEAHRGFAFIKYEDVRSAVLAVDNFNGVTLLDRVLRVEHKKDFNPPKQADSGEPARMTKYDTELPAAPSARYDRFDDERGRRDDERAHRAVEVPSWRTRAEGDAPAPVHSWRGVVEDVPARRSGPGDDVVPPPAYASRGGAAAGRPTSDAFVAGMNRRR